MCVCVAPLPLTDAVCCAAGAGDLRGRLETVSERHVAQARRLAELQEAGRRLATAYGRAVATLSESLLQMEERVARAEAGN